MKAILGLLALATLSLQPVAQKDGSSLLKDWTSSLSKKSALSATIKIQQVGGTTSSFSVDLKKPNLIRIDSKDELLVGDGKEITVFDKKGKNYYKKPQTETELRDLLRPDVFAIVSPFFNANSLKPSASKELPSKTMGGQSVRVLEATFGKKALKKMVFYIPSDMVVKRAEIQLTENDGVNTQVVNASISDATLSDEQFAFKAPAGTEELKYEDIVASKWFYDLDEAKKIAEKTGKLIFVDFMASWCGPCKKMAAEVFETEDFKELGKKVVFCRIDIDEQSDLAVKYNIEAIPNVYVLKADGSVVGSMLGYGDKQSFLSELRGILGL